MRGKFGSEFETEISYKCANALPLQTDGRTDRRTLTLQRNREMYILHLVLIMVDWWLWLWSGDGRVGVGAGSLSVCDAVQHAKSRLHDSQPDQPAVRGRPYSSQLRQQVPRRSFHRGIHESRRALLHALLLNEERQF